MSVEKRTMVVQTCDGCGREQVYAEDGNTPEGTYGTVWQVTSSGGSGLVQWYACRDRCVRNAVLKVRNRAWISAAVDD